jgi:hypothetical protein
MSQKMNMLMFMPSRTPNLRLPDYLVQWRSKAMYLGVTCIKLHRQERVSSESVT